MTKPLFNLKRYIVWTSDYNHMSVIDASSGWDARKAAAQHWKCDVKDVMSRLGNDITTIRGKKNPMAKRAKKVVHKRAAKKTMRHRIKSTSTARVRRRKRAPSNANKSRALQKKPWYVFTLRNGKKYYATGPDHRHAFDTNKAHAKSYPSKIQAEIIGRAIAAATPHAVPIGICT